MKVIFLDIDGVMNSEEEWVYGKNCTEQPMNPGMVARLQRIINATGAQIVISSTWRTALSIHEIKRLLIEGGLDPNAHVIDATPDMWNRPRGNEIDRWLQNCWKHKDATWKVTEFVILDDNADMDPHMDRLVQTTWKKGLQDEHVEQAIKILNTPVVFEEF